MKRDGLLTAGRISDEVVAAIAAHTDHQREENAHARTRGS